MKSDDLKRKLNSVGKSVFVNYFSVFQKYTSGSISKDDCIEKLIFDGISNYNGAAIRCGNAKRIFDEGLELEALSIISNSSRLANKISEKAGEIIKIHNFRH